MQIYLQAPYPFWYFDGVTPVSTFFIFFITNLRIGELRFEDGIYRNLK